MWGFVPAAGAELVMPGPNYPDNLLDLVFEEDVTVSAGVATLFRRVAETAKERREDDSDFSLDGLRVTFAGQTPPRDLLKDLEDLGADTSQAYGYSESAGGPHFVYNKQGDFRDSEQAMDNAELFDYVSDVAGYPAMGVDLKVLDVETDEELPWDGDSPGEIAMKSPWCANGYWKMPERTAENRYGNYLRMGDFVSIDEQANVTVLDRVKDAVKSGGEWIPSPTVEEYINEHEQVAESCVIAADHPEWGERPVVVVEPVEGVSAADLDIDLGAHLESFIDEGKIQKWWVPDEIIVDDIPITGTGKFNKKALRDQYRDILE
jgi:fatty-acyl-CoA synthase